ncbi:hypothetical protein V2J09_007992 [Rumex salicifolius]
MATTIKLILLTLALTASTSLSQNTIQDYVASHNAARSSVYPLGGVVWDATLASYAQNYANKRKADCYLQHSDGPYGENIAVGYGTFSGTDAVKLWVNEKPYYDYGSNTCIGGKECLHYTQVVWKESVRIGCARAVCVNSQKGLMSKFTN